MPSNDSYRITIASRDDPRFFIDVWRDALLHWMRENHIDPNLVPQGSSIVLDRRKREIFFSTYYSENGTKAFRGQGPVIVEKTTPLIVEPDPLLPGNG